MQSSTRFRDDDLFPTLSLHVGFCDIEQRLATAFPHSAVKVSHLPGAFLFPTSQTWDVPAHQHDSYIRELLFPSYLTCASILSPSEIGSHSSVPQPRFCRTGLGAL